MSDTFHVCFSVAYMLTSLFAQQPVGLLWWVILVEVEL